MPLSVTLTAAPNLGENTSMVMWPAVTLIGFLVLTAFVIAMGTQSTARYERERAEGTSGARHGSPEAVGAARAA